MISSTKYNLPPGTKVPDHICIAMDGNGRWARSRGMSATQGHDQAAGKIKKVIEYSRDLGVHTLTLWGFSTENWKRPKLETLKIMSIIKKYITQELKNAEKEGVRFVHLGRKDRLPKDVLKWIVKAEKETKNNKKYILNLAIDYGGHDEIIRAIQKIIKSGAKPEQVDEELVKSFLDTHDQPYPYPDLHIRTSGEQRTSGFMLWQSAYSEFYWEEALLPDLTYEHLRAAILDYSRRRRRFGGKGGQKHMKFRPEIVAGMELAWWRLGRIPENTKFTEYTFNHIKEQFGMSKKLSTRAAKYMALAVLQGRKSQWKKAKENLAEFYTLVKDEIKMAFEPEIAANLEVKLWQEMNHTNDIAVAADAEDIAKNLYAETYRMSLFQAGKVAHLRVMAGLERKMAEAGMGEEHWDRAEDYLQKFYRALKERVA